MPSIPKTHRYSLGMRIDALFIDVIEAIASATYLPRGEKLSDVQRAIRKLDVVQVLLMVLWESKSLDNKKYVALSIIVDDIGKILGGWRGQILKQTAPGTKPGAQ